MIFPDESSVESWIHRQSQGDPKPKAKKNGFFSYFLDVRKRYRSEDTEIKAMDYTVRRAGVEWDILSPEKKKLYSSMNPQVKSDPARTRRVPLRKPFADGRCSPCFFSTSFKRADVPGEVLSVHEENMGGKPKARNQIEIARNDLTWDKTSDANPCPNSEIPSQEERIMASRKRRVRAMSAFRAKVESLKLRQQKFHNE